MAMVCIPYDLVWTEKVRHDGKTYAALRPEFAEWLQVNLDLDGYSIFRGRTLRKKKQYSVFLVRDDTEAVMMRLRWSS